MLTKSNSDIEFKICLKVHGIPNESLQNILTNIFYNEEQKTTALKEVLKDAQLDILDLYWDI